MSDRKKKSRRSSILKPPKPRNPLSDVDLNPPTETTILKSRRVSFARVNVKKEFSSDPEKNTIWHTSYEEEMNRSDKSDHPNQIVEPSVNLSVEDMSLDSDVMNCTQMIHLDDSIATTLANNSLETSISSAVIDLTEHHGKIAPKLSQLPNYPHFNEIQQSVVHTHTIINKTASETVVVEKENICSKRQTIHFIDDTEGATMEFTQSVPPKMLLELKENMQKQNKEVVNFETNSKNATMDITQAIVSDNIDNNTKRQTINFNNDSEGATMEFTQVVPPHLLSKLNKNDQKENRHTINFKTDSENAIIDLTNTIPHKNINKNSKRQTINFNNDSEGATMEFTQVVPPHMLSKLNKNAQKENRQTINFKTDSENATIDLTQTIPHKNINKNSKRQTINYNNDSEGATMEFTQVVPPQMLSKLNKNNVICSKNRQTVHYQQNDEQLDLTQTVAQTLSEKCNNGAIKKQPTESEGSTMELTKSISSEMLLNYKNRQMKLLNQNDMLCNMDSTLDDFNQNDNNDGVTMEMTQFIPCGVLNKNTDHLKRQTINFRDQEDENMDFTRAAIVEKENIPIKLLPEQYTEDLTEYISPVYFLNQREQTINFKNKNKEDLSEFVIVDKENIPVKYFSEQTPVYLTDNIPPIHQQIQKRQTIYFNQHSEEDNLEVTEVIPSEIFVNYKENLQQNCKSYSSEHNERKTIRNENQIQTTQKIERTHNFNQTTSTGENMEITNIIPQNIKSTNRKTINFNQNSSTPENLAITNCVPQNIKTTNRKTINFNQSSSAPGNLDITDCVPQNIIENIKTTNRKTINFNQSSSAPGNLDITDCVPQNIIENIKTTNRKTINFNQSSSAPGNLDITDCVPQNIIENIKTTNRKTINFNQSSSAPGNLDITDCVPQNIIENIKTTNRKTINFNQSSSAPGNLDITDCVPQNIIENIKSTNRKTINFNQNSSTPENLAITNCVPQNIKTTNRKTINFNQSSSAPGNLDITDCVPQNIIENIKTTNRKTINFNQSSSAPGNLDITDCVPQNIIENIKSTNRKTINFNQNSSTPENLAITNCVPQNIKTTNRKTINFNQSSSAPGNLDITDCVPQNIIENIKTTNRKTINFNQSSSTPGNLDITDCVPQNIENIERTNRKTINFNKNSSSLGNLEITDCAPQNFAENIERANKKTINLNQICCTDEILEITENIPQNFVDNHDKVNQQTIFFDQACSTLNNIDLIEDISVYEAHETLIKENTVFIDESYDVKAVTDSPKPEKEVIDIPQRILSPIDITSIQNSKIFRLKGQPLVLTPNSEENLDDSDICQRIKLPGQKDDFSVSKINLSEKLDLTPVNNPNSFNLTANSTSVVDSTEKLINCKIDLPSSEYSKIISDEFDKNYTIINESLPDMEEMHDKESESSIISFDSSVEKMSEIDKIKSQIHPPLFNFDEALRQISEIFKSQTEVICDETNMLQSIKYSGLSIKEQYKLCYNIDVDKNEIKNDTINLIRNFEEEKPKKMYQNFNDLVQKKKQEQEKKEPRKELTILDKIKRMINKDTLWVLLPNEEFSFTYMSNLFKIIVELETNSEIVKKIESVSHVNESTCPPFCLYIHPRLQKKLNEEQIKAAVGQNYTIFSLLDYLTKIGEEFMDILAKFQHLRFYVGIDLDLDLNATFIYTNPSPRLGFKISCNLNDLDRISPELITIKKIVGSPDENAIKRLIKHCPTGFAFLEEYNRLVNDYLKVLEASQKK